MSTTSADSAKANLSALQVEDLLLEPDDRFFAQQHSVARLSLLWDSRRFIAGVALWGLIVAIVIAVLIPSRYESTTRLMPPEQRSGNSAAMMAAAFAGKADGMSSVAQNLLGVSSTGALFVGILQSSTVEDHIVDKFDLHRVYRQRTGQAARKQLERYTTISEDRKSGIITITVTDLDRNRAAAMATEYVEELNRVVIQLTGSSAHRERIFLEQRIKEVNHDLQVAENDLGRFSSKNSAIDIKEQGRAMVGAAATLEGELIASESELQGLSQIYAENNVRIRSLHARINELRNQLARLGGKEGGARSDLDSLYPSIRQLPILGVSFADLYRKVQIEEAVFETLTKEYELAKVEEAREIPSVSVLDPANIPEKKVSPSRAMVAIGGMLLAFAGGVVLVFGRALWLEMDASDPRKTFAIEVTADFRNDLSRFLQKLSRLRRKNRDGETILTHSGQ